jgi:hypothetical protein
MARYGNIFFLPGIVRVSFEDPAPGFLEDKLTNGEGVTITTVNQPWEDGGQVLVVSMAPGAGSGNVLTLRTPGAQVTPDVSTVFIDASQGPVEVIFPEAAAFLGSFTLVCLDNSNPITLQSSSGSTIFAPENFEFHTAGDAFIFQSDRVGVWYAISRYTANWYA